MECRIYFLKYKRMLFNSICVEYKASTIPKSISVSLEFLYTAVGDADFYKLCLFIWLFPDRKARYHTSASLLFSSFCSKCS